MDKIDHIKLNIESLGKRFFWITSIFLFISILFELFRQYSFLTGKWNFFISHSGFSEDQYSQLITRYALMGDSFASFLYYTIFYILILVQFRLMWLGKVFTVLASRTFIFLAILSFTGIINIAVEPNSEGNGTFSIGINPMSLSISLGLVCIAIAKIIDLARKKKDDLEKIV